MTGSIRVKIANDLVAQWMRDGFHIHGFKITKGLPKDATLKYAYCAGSNELTLCFETDTIEGNIVMDIEATDLRAL